MPSAGVTLLEGLLLRGFHFDATLLPHHRVDLPGERDGRILLYLQHVLYLQQALLWFHAVATATASGKKRVGEKAGGWVGSGGMEEEIGDFAVKTGRVATKAWASPAFWVGQWC